MNPTSDPDLPADPEERELYRLLAAFREAHKGGRPFPSLTHLSPALRRRWDRMCAMTLALDMASKGQASSSTLPNGGNGLLSSDHFTISVTAPSNGAPARIGRYQVVRERGRGGMGVVWEVTDPDLGRRIALKQIHPALSSEARKRAAS